MTEQFKVSFSQLSQSKAYQIQAANWCKAHLFIVVAVAIAMALFSEMRLGFKWLWVFPSLFFGIPIIVSLPTMLFFVWLVVQQSGHMKYEPFQPPMPADTIGRALNMIKSGWSWVSMALSGYVAFIFIKWAGS